MFIHVIIALFAASKSRPACSIARSLSTAPTPSPLASKEVAIPTIKQEDVPSTLYYKHSSIDGAEGVQDDARFAVIQLSGSQVKVTPGDTVITHKLKDLNAGEEVRINDVSRPFSLDSLQRVFKNNCHHFHIIRYY
jgi:hypothetical protein